MRKLCLLIALLLCACGTQVRTVFQKDPAPAAESKPQPSTQAPGRSTVGNGSDYFSQEHGSAWFLGKEKIRYCVEVAPDFGARRIDTTFAVMMAFHRWRNYLRKNRINDPDFHPERGLKPGDPEITMERTELKKCDGSQELTIYFGVENEEVKKYLPYYDRPYAISERTEYHPETGRGKGFIWIAKENRYGHNRPSWNLSGYPVVSLLMHELGHVAGCGHVRGTIMDENLPLIMNEFADHYVLLRESNERQWMSVDYWGLYSPERSRLLISCPRCDYKSSGWFYPKNRLVDKALLGDDKYPVATQLDDKGPGLNEIPFLVHTTQGTTKLKIHSLSFVTDFKSDAPIFRAVFQRPGVEGLTTVSSQSSGAVYHGFLTSATGADLSVLLKWNTAGNTYAIDWEAPDGHVLPLFELDTVLESNGILE